MLTLEQQLKILFYKQSSFELDRIMKDDWLIQNVENEIKGIIAESTAIGDADIIGDNIMFTEEQKRLCIPRTFDLLQVNKPIAIYGIITPVGYDSYHVRVKMVFTERKDCFTVEHQVIDCVSENVPVYRLIDRLKRILNQLPELASEVIVTH